MAVEAIEKLLAKTSAKHVILSYSSSGKATAEELYEMLSQSGKMLDFVKVDYKRNVMATMRWTNEWTREIEKGNQELLFLIQR
jgi:adenine-specific DNA-methyltransferase